MIKEKNELHQGDKFGEWTVLKKAGRKNKRIYYTCVCSCGTVRDVEKVSLVNGNSCCCGCIKIKVKPENDPNIGKTFGLLKVLDRLNTRGSAKYLCQCECGNKVIKYGHLFIYGGATSCGCINTKSSREVMSAVGHLGQEKIKEMSKEGTMLLSLVRKVGRNNTTGVKGVCATKNGKYRAYITLKRKSIHLGVFPTLEEAKKAREEAEKKYFLPILEKYKQNDDEL